jgi:hypothetical protein
MDEQSLDDDPLCLVFIPALVAVLHQQERAKGSPLTEVEVHAIRDKSVCMRMRYSHALEMEEKRGYSDVRPEHCWDDWQQVRTELSQNGQ